MQQRLLHPLAILILLLFAAVPAWSQEDDSTLLPESLAGWGSELKDINETLKQTGPDDDALAELRERIEKVQQELTDHTAKLKSEYDRVDSMLAELGPAPKEGEPAESESAANVRKTLSERVAEFDGLMKTVQVMQTRAGQLSNEIQERRRNLFASQLQKRVQSPLNPSLWRGAVDDSAMMLRAFGFLLSNWWSKLASPGIVFVLFAVSVAAWIGLRIACRRMTARYRRHDADAPPPAPLERTASAAGVTVARALPPIAAACILILGLHVLGQLSGAMQSIAIAVLIAFCTVVGLMALVQTILALKQPMWRIFPANDRDSSVLLWLAWGIAIVYGIDRFLAAVNSALAAPIPVTVAQSSVTTITVALLMAAMLRVRLVTPQQQTQDGEEAVEREPGQAEVAELAPVKPRRAPKWLRALLWVLVGVILVAVAFGYIAFARFLANQTIVTGSILILLWLFHLAIEDFASGISNPERGTGRWLGTRLTEQKRSQIGIAISLLLHAIVLAIVVPLIALQWGFDWEDLRTWLSKFVSGFQIGDWRISPVTIVMAILLFILGLVASGFFQRWLDARVLTRAQLDQGARSAIRTGVGYLGVAVAALIAVSYAGFDFSNIAIVAGALSVGIGFGLQSIVNNFVSGLILLAERRVRIGDRIEVGAEEGFVRRISVRATEIETFDRNFVIIPNSDLMTNSVKNWTFQNRHGRILIDIGVSYDCDPDQVKEILLRIAHEHPAIVDRDKTGVWLTSFADSAVMFRLAAFVGDISYLLDAHSDMNFAIMREFRAAGIEIPFPQRDLNLRDIDRLEAAILGRARPVDKRKTSGT